jgi:hypothetical protein
MRFGSIAALVVRVRWSLLLVSIVSSLSLAAAVWMGTTAGASKTRWLFHCCTQRESQRQVPGEAVAVLVMFWAIYL